MHRRISGLDIIRGVAIGLVMLRHSWPNVFGGAGTAGVVAFFGLSGYLITGVLLGDIRKVGRIRYRRFYLHRALRLIPPLLFMLIGLLAVTFTFDPLHDREEVIRTLAVAASYTADLPFNHGSPAISHLWTLATEEQFYLIWPIALAIAVSLRQTWRAVLVAGVGIYAVSVLSVMLVAEPVKLYPLPTSWAVAMVIGAGAKIAEGRFPCLSQPIYGRLRVTITAGSLAVLVGLALTPDTTNWAGTYLLIAPAIGAASVGLILGWRDWVVVPPVMKPLLGLGTISYACYLWNYPIARWFFPTSESHGWLGLAIVLATLAAGIASWYLVERPTARLRRRLDVALADKLREPDAESTAHQRVG